MGVNRKKYIGPKDIYKEYDEAHKMLTKNGLSPDDITDSDEEDLNQDEHGERLKNH